MRMRDEERMGTDKTDGKKEDKMVDGGNGIEMKGGTAELKRETSKKIHKD